ncbi:hypothetical protein N7482_010788 [Penicillium canariense]|uniref:Uncharacterized protein n=1 Tax=Penicillium canariense TaxID=189055 RepID=A0A9W9HND0_9EURO|nr:hypothetical protein N7482_010783 [Penicillium canariense]KAJ5151536.1 hypothetical protein N7482_010788 [Penicillium canariense]
MPQPVPARPGGGRNICVRTVGAIRWPFVFPRYAGGIAAAGRPVRPFRLTKLCPFGGIKPCMSKYKHFIL